MLRLILNLIEHDWILLLLAFFLLVLILYGVYRVIKKLEMGMELILLGAALSVGYFLIISRFAQEVDCEDYQAVAAIQRRSPELTPMIESIMQDGVLQSFEFNELRNAEAKVGYAEAQKKKDALKQKILEQTQMKREEAESK